MKNNTTNLTKYAVDVGSDTAHGGLLLLHQVLLDEVVWHDLADQEQLGPDGPGDTGRVVDFDEQLVS